MIGKWLTIPGFVLFKILEGLVSIILTLGVVGPILLVLALVNECVRGVVSVLLLVKHKGKIQLTNNGQDNVWGYESPGGGNCRNVLFVAVYENKIDGAKYRSRFLEEVIHFRAPDGTQPYLKLKKVYVKSHGWFCWKDDVNFDTSKHIIVYPEDEVVTESDLLRLLAELSKDMDESKPQWEEIIIPCFQYDKYRGTPLGGNEGGRQQSARILRFHHAFGDAGSWLLLYSFCAAGGKIPYAVDPLKGYPVSNILKILYFVNGLIFGTTTAIKAAWNGHGVNNRLVTPRYSGEKFYCWSETLPLNTLKEIKIKTKTSLSVLLASIVAGAVRRYDVKYPRKNGSLGKESYLGAVAAILPYPSFLLQNRFTIFNFPVPTGEMSAAKRLEATNRKASEFALSPEPIVNYYLFSYFGRFPSFMCNFLMRCCGTPMIFSNLPGASETFSLWGDSIYDGAAWVPLLTTAGLSLAAAGYKDGVRFCGATDSACMTKEELEFILLQIKNEIGELAEQTLGLV